MVGNREWIALFTAGPDGDSRIRVSETGGNFEPAEIATEATLYGAEVMEDGTVIAVGDDGTIVEGCPN